MYKKYTLEQVGKAKEMHENGASPYKIGKDLGLSKGTANYWAKKNFEITPSNSGIVYDYNEDGSINFNPEQYLNTPEKRKAYSYILALYLCDGHIVRYRQKPGLFLIRFFNDFKYPIDSEEWRSNLQILLPDNSCHRYKPKNKNIWLTLAYSKILPLLFPQYGLGKKHDRKMNLEKWQQDIISEYPKEFIRACFQSDGSLYLQSVGPYKYLSYNFTNKSEDIIDWFLSTLKLININKEKYWHKTKEIYFIQNFSKEDKKILQTIIDKKN
jgi:hypothetical protein